MAFLNQKEIKKISNKLKSVDGTLALPAKATPLEKFRFGLQQKFVSYKIKNNLSQKNLAQILGVDEAKMSKILHHRLEEFSTDRLITLYQKIELNLKLAVG